MITGVNDHFEFEGTDYHIQIEDISDAYSLEIRVYVGGAVLFQKRQPYEELIGDLPDSRDAEAVLQEEMAKLVKLVQAAIRKGRITVKK
jgi:hypothetical protein